ncbi:MAG TPA: 2'-5' RNA ligase family protein [Cyclobacteriaceae bacterium]|nr:2'-5' RNA ligase family protein [Cyclobacteriaceae bacterium]
METSTETFVIISPPESILRDVFYLKRSIREILGHTFEGEFSKAHVSLLKYRDPHIDNELYRINNLLFTFKPFTLYIKDFDILHHGNNRSISFNVINKNPVRELSETISGRDIRPHITIAKNLSASDFEKVWAAIKGITYSNHFWCDHLTVLKRSDGPWRHYMDLCFDINVETQYLASLHG